MTQSSKKHIPAPAMDQFNYALQALGEQTMHYVIEFAGRIDEDRLRVACHVTMQLVPVLGCRFVGTKEPYWEPSAPGTAHDIVFLRHSTDTEHDVQEVLVTPLDPGVDNPVRLTLIRTVDRDILCVTVHHAAMDAHGLMIYTQLLASCYQDPDAWRDAQPFKESDRSLAAIVSRYAPGECKPSPSPAEIPVSGWAFPARAGRGRKRAFAIRTVSPERLDAIKHLAKSCNGTVNDVLLAAFFSASCDYIHPDPDLLRPVLHSIDMRRYLNNAQGAKDHPASAVTVDSYESYSEQIANFSVAFDVFMPTGDCSFEDRIRQATAAMRVHKDTNPGMASAMETESFGYDHYADICEHVRMMKETFGTTGSDTLFLSNIGILPDATLTFSSDVPISHAYIAGIVLDLPGVALGVTTFRNRLTFSIGYGCDTIPDKMIEQFLDTVIGYFPVI